jgi:TPR repeat protein
MLKAAKRGFAPAQFSVALSYSRGEGIARDLAKARHWYELAAAQGDSDAQHNLDLLLKRSDAAA